MGISPIALTWLAREQARARIKALKDAAEFLGRDCRNDPASTGPRSAPAPTRRLTWTSRIGAALSVPDLRGSSHPPADSNRV